MGRNLCLALVAPTLSLVAPVREEVPDRGRGPGAARVREAPLGRHRGLIVSRNLCLTSVAMSGNLYLAPVALTLSLGAPVQEEVPDHGRGPGAARVREAPRHRVLSASRNPSLTSVATSGNLYLAPVALTLSLVAPVREEVPDHGRGPGAARVREAPLGRHRGLSASRNLCLTSVAMSGNLYLAPVALTLSLVAPVQEEVPDRGRGPGAARVREAPLGRHRVLSASRNLSLTSVAMSRNLCLALVALTLSLVAPVQEEVPDRGRGTGAALL